MLLVGQPGALVARACAVSTGKNKFHNPQPGPWAWRFSMVLSALQRLPAAVLAANSHSSVSAFIGVDVFVHELAHLRLQCFGFGGVVKVHRGSIVCWLLGGVGPVNITFTNANEMKTRPI